MDITSIDLRSAQAEEESRAKVKTIVESYATIQQKVESPTAKNTNPIILSRDRERGSFFFSYFYGLTNVQQWHLFL